MFWKRKKEIKFEDYTEEPMTQRNKEEEIMSSYEEDYEYVDEEDLQFEGQDYSINENDYEDDFHTEGEDETEVEGNSTDREVKFKKIINISFIVIMIILSMVAIDVISVARYDKGPFFAIPITKYKDGGTKAYYGIGYKVIKYNQIQGRKDSEIGTWSLKYNAEPISIKDIDLAIEFQGRERTSYEKYYKKFLRVSSKLISIDKSNNKLILGYQDEGEKYSLNIECELVHNKTEMSKLETGKDITIIGTVTNFSYKTKNSPNTITINNCYATH